MNGFAKNCGNNSALAFSYCSFVLTHRYTTYITISLITKFMGPTRGPYGADRTQMGPMLAPWTLLSEIYHMIIIKHFTWVDVLSIPFFYNYANTCTFVLNIQTFLSWVDINMYTHFNGTDHNNQLLTYQFSAAWLLCWAPMWSALANTLSHTSHISAEDRQLMCEKSCPLIWIIRL